MKKGLFKKVISVLITSVMAVSLAACGNTNNQGEKQSALEKIKASGKFVIGTSADFPPYEFHKEIDGKDEIVGFDIEIAKAIADALGVKLEIKDMDFEGLLTALNAGAVDAVFAGMNPTAERAEKVDFSEIYYMAEQTLLIRAEDKDKYTGIEALTGLKVGAQKSTIQEDMVTEQIKDAQVVGLAKIPDLVLQLKTGKVEAVAVENTVADSYAKANSDLTVATFQFEVPEEEKGAAVAVKKGSDDLVAELNKILTGLKSEGKIDQFVIDANELVEGEE